MTTGERIAVPEVWLRYRGHRANSTKPMNPRDAEYWVTSVVVPELRRERQLARERGDARTERREGPPPAPKLSPAEERRLADQLAQRVMAAKRAAAQ